MIVVLLRTAQHFPLTAIYRLPAHLCYIVSEPAQNLQEARTTHQPEAKQKCGACGVLDDIKHLLLKRPTYYTERNGLFGALCTSGSPQRTVAQLVFPQGRARSVKRTFVLFHEFRRESCLHNSRICLYMILSVSYNSLGAFIFSFQFFFFLRIFHTFQGIFSPP